MPEGLLINGCGELSDTTDCPNKFMACGCRNCGTCTETLPVDLD